MWLWNRTNSKANFDVWYLGSKESTGVRGSTVILPVMRQLLRESFRESFRKSPNKATVQVSNKGLKLVQSVLTMSKTGKMKTQLAKINVASNCITYSMVGKAPFDDVVGVVMLCVNPEMMNPLHVHIYRCDCPENAAMLQANLQMLIGRQENQKSINSLEHRLFLTNIWDGKSENLNDCQTLRPARRLQSELKTRLRSTQSEQDADLSSIGPALLGGTAFGGGLNLPPYLRNKRYSISDLPSVEPRLRMFGDTMKNAADKSRSMDGLNKLTSNVSRNLRGENSFRIERFPRSENCDPFGRIYEQSLEVDNFWKNRKQRNLKI